MMMLKRNERPIVAKNCFAFSGENAKQVEAQAGALMAIQAKKDARQYKHHLRTMHGGNSWRSGMASKNAGVNQKITQPYDAALVAIVDDWARTGDVQAAYNNAYPDGPEQPTNFSQALTRLWNAGLIARKPDAKPHNRMFLWASLGKETDGKL